MLIATKVHHLEEIMDTYKEYDVIAIDEGQFFSEVNFNYSCNKYQNLWNRLSKNVKNLQIMEKLLLLLHLMPLFKEKPLVEYLN